MISDEYLSRMAREITMNVPRKESLVPINAETTKYWNRLVKQIAKIKADGRTVEIPFETPSVDLVDPKMIVEIK